MMTDQEIVSRIAKALRASMAATVDGNNSGGECDLRTFDAIVDLYRAERRAMVWDEERAPSKV